MKKFFLFIILFFIVIITLAFFFVFLFPKTVLDLAKDSGRKLKDFIYYEATIHNPSGDVLPDQIDDQLKEGVKSFLE